jgi:ATP-binding cassette subfamily C protein/ATP-binding cassette subfamily C protein LapB
MTPSGATMSEPPGMQCLGRLLAGLHWNGPAHLLSQALPHEHVALDHVDLRNVLAELGWIARPLRKTRLGSLSGDRFPLLLAAHSGRLLVIERAGAAGSVMVFEPGLGGRSIRIGEVPRGRLWWFEPRAPDKPTPATPSRAWTSSAIRRFRGSIVLLATLSLLTLLPATAVPMFTLLVFDLVLPSGDLILLAMMLVAALAVLTIDLLIARLRSRRYGQLTARLGRLVAVAVFRQLHDLTPLQLENAPVQQQVDRLRQFDGVRDAVGEQVLGTGLAILASIPLCAVLMLLVGWPALIAVAVMGGALIVAALHLAPLRRAIADGAEARQQRDLSIDEVVRDAVPMRLAGASWVWLDRIAQASGRSAAAGCAASTLQRRLQDIGSMATQLASYAALFVMAHACITGALSVGVMVSGSYLISRVLAPWQQALVHLPRLVRLRSEIASLEAFLALPKEGDGRVRSPLPRRISGRLRMENVGLSYAPTAPPALLGVSLEVEPGEILGIEGTSGAGKSTLLKVVLGMVQPQVGRITLDHVDLRQMHPRELRAACSYLPQRPHLYSGTIAQNLRLGWADASESDLRDACDAAAVLEEIERLPDGFGTRLRDLATERLSASFVQRLCLARTFLRPVSLVLLDEPGRSLDPEADARLTAWLEAGRGRRTVLMVSHRPSHLALADRVLRLDGGRQLRPPEAPSTMVRAANPERTTA